MSDLSIEAAGANKWLAQLERDIGFDVDLTETPVIRTENDIFEDRLAVAFSFKMRSGEWKRSIVAAEGYLGDVVGGTDNAVASFVETVLSMFRKRCQMAQEASITSVNGATRSIGEWTKEIHETAKAKGWWDQPRTAPEVHMLIVTEIAEATECARNNDSHIHIHPETKEVSLTPKEGYKPEGEAVELADAVIRIMDYFGYRGWDLEKIMKSKHAYNQTRAHRHGGKKF